MKRRLNNVEPVSFMRTRLREMIDECKTQYGLSIEQADNEFTQALRDLAIQRGWRLRLEIDHGGRCSVITSQYAFDNARSCKSS